MRTIAQETAFQIVLRNRSKGVGGEVSIYMILVNGGMCSQAHFCRDLLLVTRSRCHR